LKPLNEKHLEEYMDQYRKMNNAESTIIKKIYGIYKGMYVVNTY